MYKYRAKYIENYDGDTIKFMVDLGFGVFKKITVRLARVDTPEIRPHEDGALEAKNFVNEVLTDAKFITIETFKDSKGKYGRYIAEVYYDGRNLSDMLLSKGLAELYEG